MTDQDPLLPSDLDLIGNITCDTVQKLYPDIVDNVQLKITFAILYSSVMVCGLIGNLLTLYCVTIMKVNVGINAAFVISFVCSNLTIALLSLPSTAHHLFVREWLLGATLCRLVPFFQMSGTFVSSFTLAAIAIDRYRNVCKRRIQYNKGLRLDSYAAATVLMCIVAAGASLPFSALVMDIVNYRNVCGVFCEEVWQGPMLRSYATLAIMFMQFVLPLIILAYCYGCMKNTLDKSMQRREQYSLSDRTQDEMRRKKSRTNMMMMFMFAAFVGPWLPFNLVHILRDFGKVPAEFDHLIFAVVHLIAMTSTMWNPIIYCGINAKFRAEICKVLPIARHFSSTTLTRTGTVDHSRAVNGTAGGRSRADTDEEPENRLRRMETIAVDDLSGGDGDNDDV